MAEYYGDDDDAERTTDFFEMLDLDSKTIRRFNGSTGQSTNILADVSSCESLTDSDEEPEYSRYQQYRDEPYFGEDQFGCGESHPDNQDEQLQKDEEIEPTKSMSTESNEQTRKRGRKSINPLEPMPKITVITTGNPEEQGDAAYPAMTFGSKGGVHLIYLYRIPPALDKCYVFQFKKQLADKDLMSYCCISCKNIVKEAPRFTCITVSKSSPRFLQDPHSLDHSCSGIEYATEYAKRSRYEILQGLRSQPTLSTAKTVYMNRISQILENPDLSNDEKIDAGSQFGSFAKLKPQLNRALRLGTGKCDFSNIPDEYSKGKIPGIDEAFVQSNDEQGLVMYHRSLVRAVSQLGITHILADGTHGFLQADLGRNGQLYTCHALTKSGFFVPLLHCFTRHKNQKVYLNIFGMLKDELLSAGCDLPTVTIVTDFEAAALSAISEIFKKSPQEGCLYHFCQALNRKAKCLGPYKNDVQVSCWYSRLLALSYLPEEFFEISGVLEIPVGADHPAYAASAHFLEYFNNTWLGNWKNLWLKYGIASCRTNNAAESFHKALKLFFSTNANPPLHFILEYLRQSQVLKFLDLQNELRGQLTERYVTPAQKLKEQQIEKNFDELQQAVVEKQIDRQYIEAYLDKMTVYLPRKAH